MLRKKLLGTSAVALILSGAIAAPANAQGENAGLDEGVLEEIIVTAQRREERIQDVPISITTMGREKMDNLTAAGADIRFLSARIPSLYVESSFGRTFPRFYIRGLGNTDFDLNGSQPVSLVYDDVVLENPILKGFPVFDLDQIEVFRGPQGTLFGRNTPAGIVKFDSKRPSQEMDGYGKVSFGRFNQIDFEGAVGGPLSDSLSVRASIMYQERDGYVDNTFTGKKNALEGYDEIAGRLQVLFEPSAQFSALLNVHARSLDGTARVFRANILNPGTGGFVAGFKRGEVAIDGQNSQDVDEFGFVAKLEYDFGSVTVTSITAFETVDMFSRGDIDGGFGAVFAPPFGPGFIPFDAESADAIPDLDQFTQEVRIASNELGAFDYQAGVFFFSEDLQIDSFSFSTLFGGGQNGFATQKQDTNAWAIFASADYDVTDRLKVSGGVRYSEDDKDFIAERTMSNLGFLGVGPLPPTRANTNDTAVSWDISATYQATESVNYYGRIARSFRAPSIQGRVLFATGDGSDPALDGISVAGSEKNLSFEAGVKAELLDGRARFSLNAFFYKLDDPQLTAVGGVNNINTILNADEVEGFGFEFDLQMAPTNNLFITAGLSFNDTEIQDKNLAIASCGGGCTVLDPAGPVAGSVLIDGNSLPQAPRWIANWTARYGVPVGTNSEVYAYADMAYRSRVHFFLYEAVEFQDESLVELGIRLGYVHNDGQFEVSVFGRNITNERSLSGGIDFNNLTGFVNEPSVWGVELGVSF